MGISGFGTTVTGATTGTIGKIRDVNGWGGQVDRIEDSAGDNADRWKTFFAGAREGKPITLTIVYTKAGYAAALTNLGSDNEAFTIAFPDSSSFVTQGYIADVSGVAPWNGEMVFNVTIQPSGQPTFTAGT